MHVTRYRYPRNKVLWHRDVHSNSVAVVPFQEKSDLLEFDSEVVIEHYEETPVSVSLDAWVEQYPFQYDVGEREVEVAEFDRT